MWHYANGADPDQMPLNAAPVQDIPCFYAPRHDNGRALSVTPVRPSVRTYVRTYLRTYVRILSKRRPLSKSNTFDPNFMKLGQNVKYHDVFFKFDNGPYRTLLSVVMALCL